MLLLQVKFHAQRPTSVSSHEQVRDHFSQIIVKATVTQVYCYIQFARMI